MSIREFWRSTPREIGMVIRAYSKRLRNLQRILAWHAAINVQPWCKSRVRPRDLMRGFDEDE